MGEVLHVRFEGGRVERRLPDGRRMVIRSERRRSRGKAGSTSKHEARHAVAGADDVVRATIIPGPGYRGATWFTRFNAAAAAAPHAHGDSGTSYDVALIERSGTSLGAAVHAAHAALSGKEEHVQAVAEALEEKKTLSGSEIRKIMADVDDGFEVVVEIFPAADDDRPDKKTLRMKRSVTMLEIPIELPRTA